MREQSEPSQQDSHMPEPSMPRKVLETLPRGGERLQALSEAGDHREAAVFQTVLGIARSVREAGGRAMLVGGGVRDLLLGRQVKDYDLEVYGLAPERLEELASSFGSVNSVGKAFGILKIQCEGFDIDLSMPRTDSKISEGHRGFAVKADPFMTVENAARRRDFTINSMAADPETGEVVDPFGGREDLEHGILRVTDEERFADDPLRVLRGLQFIGRFDLAPEPKTAAVMERMASQLKELPKERIFEEWRKLLLFSKEPAKGLRMGMALGVFRELHPELPALAATPQEPEWHPEGDVWTHTMMVMDAAANRLRAEQRTPDESLAVLLASLAHDLGKASTTQQREDGAIISYGHEQAGVEPTAKLMESMGVPQQIREKVVRLVADHLAPGMLHAAETYKHQHVTDGAIRRLARRLHPATIEELTLVAEADHLGRGPFPDPENPGTSHMPRLSAATEWLRSRARVLGVGRERPPDVLQGRDLIEVGLKPGAVFGKIIHLANELRDEHGLTKDDVLECIGTETDPIVLIEKLRDRLDANPPAPDAWS